MAPPRRPDPPPLHTDVFRTVLVGVVLWAVAFVVLAAGVRSPLRTHHATWWLWTCVAGIGLGLIGLVWVRRLERAGRIE